MATTRFSAETGIIIKNLEGFGWAHFDTNGSGSIAKVGCWYPTKAELMADHESYLIRAGWLPAGVMPESAESPSLTGELLASLNDVLALARIKWGNLDADAVAVFERADAAIARAGGAA